MGKGAITMNRIIGLMLILFATMANAQFGNSENSATSNSKQTIIDTVHLIISDSVTVKALEYSQKFYSVSFRNMLLLLLTGILIAIVSVIIGRLIIRNWRRTENNSEKGKKIQDKILKEADILLMTLKPIAVLITIFLIILPFVLPIVLNYLKIESLSNTHIFIMGVSVTIVMLIFVFPAFYIFMAAKYDTQELTTKLNDLTVQLEKSLEHCKYLTNHIEDCPRYSGQNIVEKSVLLSENDFFKYLDKARNQDSDNVEIRLTNFARSIEAQKKIENGAKKYYEDEINFCYNKINKIKLYRIVSIHTKDKFKDCIKLAKEAWEKKLPNYNLAYLHIDDFNEKLPKITGVQIINDEVILMDPIVARISNTKFREPIFIKSKKIADIYSDYYTELWEEIAVYHRQWPNNNANNKGYIGHILYTEDNMIAQDSVWKEINENIPKQERLKEKELEMAIKFLPENCFAQEKSSWLSRLFGKNKDVQEKG
jgi:hypothetical protein